jgi:hypothetical protein
VSYPTRRGSVTVEEAFMAAGVSPEESPTLKDGGKQGSPESHNLAIARLRELELSDAEEIHRSGGKIIDNERSS